MMGAEGTKVGDVEGDDSDEIDEGYEGDKGHVEEVGDGYKDSESEASSDEDEGGNHDEHERLVVFEGLWFGHSNASDDKHVYIYYACDTYYDCVPHESSNDSITRITPEIVTAAMASEEVSQTALLTPATYAHAAAAFTMATLLANQLPPEVIVCKEDYCFGAMTGKFCSLGVRYHLSASAKPSFLKLYESLKSEYMKMVSLQTRRSTEQKELQILLVHTCSQFSLLSCSTTTHTLTYYRTGSASTTKASSAKTTSRIKRKWLGSFVTSTR